MKGRPTSGPKSPRKASKGATEGFHKGSRLPGAKGHKKRRWVQPKDKSLARKTFLKVRDAKARSQFSKLQKKAREPVESSAPDLLPPVASSNDNEAFLEQLLDPFAKAKPKELASPAGGTATNRKGAEGKSARRGEDSDSSKISSETSEPAKKAAKSKVTTTDGKSGLAQDWAERHPEGFTESSRRLGASALTENKGYVPFLKARQAFEAKQRETEAIRLARLAEAEKEMKRKREKRRFDKAAHKKLQARTKKGQLVMGNVVDVLLLKMQKNAGR